VQENRREDIGLETKKQNHGSEEGTHNMEAKKVRGTNITIDSTEKKPNQLKAENKGKIEH